MSVSFYMDENVSSAITNGLRARGVDVVTAHEDFRESDPDELVLNQAVNFRHAICSLYS